MKKVLRPLALLAILAISAAACNDNGTPGTTTGATTATTGATTPATTAPTTSGGTSGTSAATTPATSAPTGPAVKVGLVYDIGGRGDKSFNDSAAAGPRQGQGDFNLDATELQPNAGGTQPGRAAEPAAEQGYQLIIGVGFLYAPTIGRRLVNFPDVRLRRRRRVRRPHHLRHVRGPDGKDGNLTSLLFAENEGAYLVGCGRGAEVRVPPRRVHRRRGHRPRSRSSRPDSTRARRSADPSIKIDHKYITPAAGLQRVQRPGEGADHRAGHVPERRRRRVPRGGRVGGRAVPGRRGLLGSERHARLGDRDRLRPVPVGVRRAAAVHPDLEPQAGGRGRLRHDQGLRAGRSSSAASRPST